MVKLLGRWAPLVGGLVLALGVILKMTGNVELANLLLNLGGVFGVTQGSPVGLAEIAAAVALVWGIVRKFIAVVGA